MSGVWMWSTVTDMVDLTFKVPSHHFLPRQTQQDMKGMSWIDYSNFYSLLRFPCIHLQCQQSNEPLPSNEGCRPPPNAVEGLSAGAGGYGETHVVGDLWGTWWLHFLSPLQLNPVPSPQPRQSPTTSKPNAGTDIPRMKWQAQSQHSGHNINMDVMASPMTTQRAQCWCGWCGKSNDNMASATLTWMTWQAQLQHGEHKIGIDDMCQQAQFMSPSPPKQRKQHHLTYPASKQCQQPCIANDDANSLSSHDQAPRWCKHPWFM